MTGDKDIMDFIGSIILASLAFLIWLGRLIYIRVNGLCSHCTRKLADCKCDWTMEY